MYPNEYRAIIYLNPIVVDNEKRYPAVFSLSTTNKKFVIEFCQKLIDNHMAVAYRVTYKTHPDSDSWYNSDEVVYLPEGAKIMHMNCLELSIT